MRSPILTPSTVAMVQRVMTFGWVEYERYTLVAVMPLESTMVTSTIPNSWNSPQSSPTSSSVS